MQHTVSAGKLYVRIGECSMFIQQLKSQGWDLKGWTLNEWIFQNPSETNVQLSGDTPWVPASVPGSVYTALMDAGIIPDPFMDMNSRACEWVNQRDWMFECRFMADRGHRSFKKHEIHFSGLDYKAVFFLNGVRLGEHEGLYTPAVFDVTNMLKLNEENHVRVIICAAPEGMPQIGFSNKVCTLKPRFTYRWDFSTRLIELGIMNSVELHSHDGFLFEDIQVRQHLEWEGLHCASASVQVVCSISDAAEGVIEADISPVDNRSQTKESSVTISSENCHALLLEVENPNLWWPNNMGAQCLYTLHVRLKDAHGSVMDERELNIGIREICFEQAEAAPADSLPYLCRVNREPMFIQGWNFVPVDQLYTNDHSEKYKWLLNMAKKANVNLLRVWGGGLIECELFYSLCDELGILVWQEFPQSGSGIASRPSHEDGFLRLLAETVSYQVRQKRNHPSLAIWCGGNELSDENGKPLDLADRNVKMLSVILQELDPDRLFLPTSSTGPLCFFDAASVGKGMHHDIHGQWKYLGNPEHYTMFNTSDSLLHSEFGADAMTSERSYARSISKSNQLPPDPVDPCYRHHGGIWWDHSPMLESLFGKLDLLRSRIYASQFLQSEALRYGIEANRRRALRCAGNILWQINEPFPNVTCTSCIDYFNVAKMGYYWVRNSYSPVLVSLRYDKLDWMAGDEFHANVFLHNSITNAMAGTLEISAKDMRGNAFFERTIAVEASPNKVRELFHAAFTVPKTESELFFVQLSLTSGERRLSNTYYFSSATEKIFSAMDNLPQAELKANLISQDQRGTNLMVQNCGEVAALFVNIREKEGNADLFIENNFTTLFPGEMVQMNVVSTSKDDYGLAVLNPKLYLEAWNAPARAVQ